MMCGDMARKVGKKDKAFLGNPIGTLPAETKRGVLVVALITVGLFLLFAAFGIAGSAGGDAYAFFYNLLGVGYFLLPLLFFILAGNALRTEAAAFTPLKILSSGVFIVAGLGFISIVGSGGGFVGELIAGPLVKLFEVYVAVLVLGGLALISLLILLEGGIPMATFADIGHVLALPARLFKKKDPLVTEPVISGANLDEEEPADTDELVTAGAPARTGVPEKPARQEQIAASLSLLLGEYTPPPLSLLERDKGRPGVGHIKANANIIKRTL
ncbi:MAG: hypothetical protein U1C66_00095, partial [Patescibacteria group bacterium]|nr:hypothetical protein [Patescibacteria group bacterium]